MLLGGAMQRLQMKEFRENAPKSSTLTKITEFRVLGLGNTLPTLEFNCYFRVGGGKPRISWSSMKFHEIKHYYVKSCKIM